MVLYDCMLFYDIAWNCMFQSCIDANSDPKVSGHVSQVIRTSWQADKCFKTFSLSILSFIHQLNSSKQWGQVLVWLLLIPSPQYERWVWTPPLISRRSDLPGKSTMLLPALLPDVTTKWPLAMPRMLDILSCHFVANVAAKIALANKNNHVLKGLWAFWLKWSVLTVLCLSEN